MYSKLPTEFFFGSSDCLLKIDSIELEYKSMYELMFKHFVIERLQLKLVSHSKTSITMNTFMSCVLIS